MLFDVDKYMHGYCQYFAIAFAEMFNGKVCLWLDKNYDTDKPYLCHAYAKVCDSFYVDALGAFSDSKYREDEFEFNDKHILELNIDEAKKLLRKLGIPYGDDKTKHEVRDFLRNNMLVLCLKAYETADDRRYFGLCYADYMSSKAILMYAYNAETGTFGTFAHTFTQRFVAQHIVGQKGFVYNDRWYMKSK